MTLINDSCFVLEMPLNLAFPTISLNGYLQTRGWFLLTSNEGVPLSFRRSECVYFRMRIELQVEVSW